MLVLQYVKVLTKVNLSIVNKTQGLKQLKRGTFIVLRIPLLFLYIKISSEIKNISFINQSHKKIQNSLQIVRFFSG